MPVNQITSDSLIPTESHFRVSAGPGAGKTYWLINHIKNVLHSSNRLAKTRKIACITYTNVAVEVILERLGTSIDRVEVCTIHSFLYNHIIKPFVSFIAQEYSIDVRKMDGHDDYIVSSKKLINWIINHPNASKLVHPYSVNQITKLEDNKIALIRWLSSIRYIFSPTGELKLVCDKSEAYYIKDKERRYLNKNCINSLDSNFIEYKKLYWIDGIIHHDDVLYFCYQLITRYPFILQVVRAKYPYFFVDEFQDTNPIQTKIVSKIGQAETIVGVIGDKAQSIYEFQGADYSQFSSFTLPGIIDYEMKENRRSTNSIIDLLKVVRTDLTQSGTKNVTGDKPLFIVGSMTNALNKCYELSGSHDVFSLSRKNITSNAIKRMMDNNIPSYDLFQELKDVDSNIDRRRIVEDCIKSVELAKQKRFKEAIKQLETHYKIKIDKDKSKKEALKHLNTMLSRYDEFKDKSLYEFYLFLKANIKQDVSVLTNKGSIKTFYEKYSYKQLAVCVIITEDKSYHRTIHKAKGTEYDNVLLILNEEKDLDFITNTNLHAEEHRINYVAISRARERLFINIPSITSVRRDRIASMGYNIETV